MTSSTTTSHPGRHHHDDGHDDGHDDELAALLDLDAEVLGAWLTTVTDLVADLRPDAGTVVDLGAGTGTGTLALAHRLPHATVVAVDRSRAMLDRLRAAADRAGVGGRVRTLEADLDGARPATGAADVVWAASSLHHLADPDRVLRDAHDALRPGGLAVVVELDRMPRVAPDDLPDAPGLGSRLAEASSTWNVHPDWGPHLERAGLVLDGVHHLTTEAVDGRYARTWLDRVRTRAHELLAPADVAALDRLLTQHPAVLDASPVRADRTVWLAHRPDTAGAPASGRPTGTARTDAPTTPDPTHDGGAR
ncbi:class I SAM-dependent methyltransferase [Cellulomonas sp. NPDC057328]|uniref:class I SAM-dependent methyltransferase n=1 Tax=Cellulomonas sp. NPDC057328 TaxID=3346101 RepID=UPI0036385BE7